MSVKITMETPDIEAQLREIRALTAKAMQEGAEASLRAAQDTWTGFRDPSGATLRGWEAEATEASYGVVNTVAYAGEVVRAGESAPAVEEVYGRIEQEVEHSVAEGLTQAIDEVLNA